MPEFDINRFRELAFGRPSLPDHPLHDENAVRKMIEDFPRDPLAGLAELTHWAISINTNDSFTAGRRGRVLLALDAATRPYWSELALQYLAPYGSPQPANGQDGDAAILRALLDSATEFATGYGFGLEPGERPSRWIDNNLALLALRRARMLARKFTLASMLHLPNIDDIWADLHLLYAMADERQVLRTAIRVYPDRSFTSSVKQEYTRLLLLTMAEPETLRSRDIELAFRIAGRVAASARLEAEPIPGAICAIEPRGSSRPIAVRRLRNSGTPALYLDSFNCLPRLKAMLERNINADLSAPDISFGPGYTLRERNAMIERLIGLWGSTPPQRRSMRVALITDVLIKCGFDSAVEVIHPLEQGNWKAKENAAPQLRIVLDHAARAEKPEVLKKHQVDARVQLVDASVAGLGLLVPRQEAHWARLGMLIATYVEPGPDWVVGALRRISAEGELLRLGIALFSRQPKLAWFRLETGGNAHVWEEEVRRERNFLEHYQRGILIDVDHPPLGPGEILLAPGVADRGSRFDIPVARGVQRIRITAVREATEDFQRADFESLGVTPYDTKDE